MRILKQSIISNSHPLIRALLLCAAVALLLSSYASAQTDPPTELLLHEDWMKYQYLPKRLEQAAELQQDIIQRAQDYAPPPGQEITARFDNYHGTDVGTYAMTVAQEALASLSIDYFTLNPLLPIFALMAPPVERFIPVNQTLLPGCELRSQIRWFDYGTCINGIVPVPGPVCSLGGLPFGLLFLTSSMVEYRWPAYKVDTSEQLYSSLYYLKPLIEAVVMPLNEIALEQLGNLLIAPGITAIERKREIEERIESMIVSATPAATAAPAQLNQNFFQQVNQIDRKYRHTAPGANGGGHGYGRVIPETANTMTVFPQPLSGANIWRFLPHVPKLALVGADLPFSTFGFNGDALIPLTLPFGGFPISKFFSLSSVWMQRWATVMLPFGEWRCMANNKYDQKTPFDILLGINPGTPIDLNNPNQRRALLFSALPLPSDDNMRLCVDKVGEQMMQYEHTRPHGTDKTFQSLWRASFEWRTFGDMLSGQYQFGVEDPNDPARSDPPDNEIDANAVGLNWEAFASILLSIFNGNGTPPAYAPDHQGAWHAWRHLFRRQGNGADLYRFFPRRGDFVNETPRFAPLDQLVKGNWAYDRGGLKQPGSTFNQSAEVWPIFKGCFGRNLAKGGIPQKGDYPLFALPGVSPLGYGPILSQSEDLMKLY